MEKPIFNNVSTQWNQNITKVESYHIYVCSFFSFSIQNYLDLVIINKKILKKTP